MLFAGLAEMFCSPPNGKQKRFDPETQISEINESEEFGMFYCMYVYTF